MTVHHCDSLTKTVIVLCNMFFKMFYCTRSVRAERFWGKHLKCISFDLFFLELNDVSMAVILLLLAHLNSLTILRPDETEAFENGIITHTTALKYQLNDTDLYLVLFFCLRLINTDHSNTHFSVFHPICKLQTMENVTSAGKVMPSINKTLSKIFCTIMAINSLFVFHQCRKFSTIFPMLYLEKDYLPHNFVRSMYYTNKNVCFYVKKIHTNFRLLPLWLFLWSAITKI